MLLTTIQQLVWCSKSHVRLIFEKRKLTVQFHECRFYIIVCRICCNFGKSSQLFCQYWDFAKLHLSHESINGLGQHHVDHTLRWWQFNWQLSFAEISTESCKIKLVRASLHKYENLPGKWMFSQRVFSDSHDLCHFCHTWCICASLGVIFKVFKVCGSNSTFVAHTFHPCVFLRVELLNVASALARKLQLLSTWKAGEASLHVNPQAALGFVHLHVLTSGCLGVETKAQLSQGNSFWRMMASPCSFVMCSTRSGWDLMVKSHWEQRYRRFFRIQYRPSGPTLPSSTLNCAGRCSISKCSSIDLFTFDLWSQLESAQVYVARLSRIIIAVVTFEPDPLASVSSVSLQWTLVPCDEVTVLTLPPLWTAPLCLARLAELLAV